MNAFCIYYVKSQTEATEFYSKVLAIEPTMNVPGMTEFTLSDGTKLGFMPEEGIRKLLGEKCPAPTDGGVALRAEIYLMVKDATQYHARAIDNDATELKPFQMMPWGQEVAYSLDADGHVLAFAEQM